MALPPDRSRRTAVVILGHGLGATARCGWTLSPAVALGPVASLKLAPVFGRDLVAKTPPGRTLRYARTAPRGEIKTYDAGHFDFYLGDPFEALVRDQTEFLTCHLDPAAVPSSPGRIAPPRR